MKAIIVERPLEIAIREVPEPVIGRPDEVKIRVISGGICGSDIGIFRGTNSLATYPRVIGHEFGGRVTEVGPETRGIAPGDIVAVDPVRSCGHCYACRHDRHNVCRDVEVVGVHRDGGFAEFVVAPASACHKLDPNKLAPDLACLAEPYSIGMQVNFRAQIAQGDTVLVMGSGPIGLCVMEIAKTRGARVMMTDIVPDRLAHALTCGADRAIDVRTEDLEAAVLDFSGGEGVAVAVDSVCSPTSVPQAMNLVCPAGRVVVLGLSDKPSEIAQVAFTKKEVTVLGSRLNNHRFPEVVRMFENGQLRPERLRSDIFPFFEVAEAMELIREHPERVCKVSLSFE